MVKFAALGDWKISGPAAEILAIAALGLSSPHYGKLGREMLRYGIAVLEGPTAQNVCWLGNDRDRPVSAGDA